MAGLEVPRIALMGSGSGTTAEYLIHHTQTGVLQAEVGLVISNNSDAKIFNRVDRLNEQYGLRIEKRHISGVTQPNLDPAEVVVKGRMPSGEVKAIAEATAPYDAVVLVGYMKKISPQLLGDKPWLNTHPGPLPATKGFMGSGAQQEVLDKELGRSGPTFHVVTAEYDEGEVLAHHPVPTMEGDTADSLFDPVQVTEKVWLPIDLNRFLQSM